MSSIAKIEGDWPEWDVLLSDGRTLEVRIRWGEIQVEDGADGMSLHDAMFGGVTSETELVYGLKKLGYIE